MDYVSMIKLVVIYSTSRKKYVMQVTVFQDRTERGLCIETGCSEG